MQAQGDWLVWQYKHRVDFIEVGVKENAGHV
jgi:hypothetical protein